MSTPDGKIGPRNTTFRTIQEIVPSDDPGAPRILFFPYAGGSAYAAKVLVPALPTGYALSAVQYPGRGPRFREGQPSTVEAIAESVLVELEPDATTILLGHSFGALVAFEAATQLVSAGQTIRMLVVSAARPPGFDSDASTHLLNDEEFAAIIVERGGFPPDWLANEDLMRFALPIIRADFLLAHTYRDKNARRLPVPIVAIGGAQDSAVPPEDLGMWEGYTEQWAGLHIVPGGHFYYLTEPAQLLGAISI